MSELLDHHGAPIRRGDLRRELAAPALGTMRTIWTDSVASGLTPVKLARVLRGAVEGDHLDYLTLAEEIEERDHHYYSVLGTRKLAVAGLEAVVEAAGEDARDVELADAVRELTETPAFGDAVFDLLDALGKGYSAIEIVWDSSGPRWRPELIWRDPHFFQFDRVGHAELRLRDTANPEGLPLPPYKFIVHVPHIKTGIPIRRGLARLAAWGYLCKAYTVKDWLAFIEVYGMPMRVGKYGPEATDADIRKLVSALVNLGSDAAAAIPRSMEVEFQNAVQGVGNNQLFGQLAEFWDKQTSKAVLGQTASTEGTPGKLGNEDAQADVREDLIKADAKDLSHTLQRDLVKPFIDLNFGPEERYPRLKLHVPEPEDLKQLTESLRVLVPLGLRVAQSEVLDKLGLPEPEADAELLGAAASPPTPSPEEEGADAPPANGEDEDGEEEERANAAALALSAAEDPAPSAGSGQGVEAALDEIEAEALAEWEELLDPVLEPIREAVANAAGYDDLAARLAEIAPQMDAAALARALGAALFKARGAGDASGSD